MRFEYSENNEGLIRRLNELVASGGISHAYIIEGDSWLDKTSFAETFAKGIFCPKGLGENCGDCGMCDKIDHGNCEDLVYVRPEASGNVKDENIETMQEVIKTRPFGKRHVVIIENADHMTLRAQNRLLKTLEEPPGDTVIILLSENIENLTPTVRSRCVRFHINHLGSEKYDHMMQTAEDLIEMFGRKAGFFEVMLKINDIIRDKESISALLDCMEVTYRNMLVDQGGRVTAYSPEDLTEKIYLIEEASTDIRMNVSPASAIKNLIIKIGG